MPLQTQLVRPMTLLVQICQYRYLHPQAIAMDIMYIQEIPIIYTLELGMIIISTMAVIMDMVDMIMTVVIGSVVITASVILGMVVTRMAVILGMGGNRMGGKIGMGGVGRNVILGKGG